MLLDTLSRLLERVATFGSTVSHANVMLIIWRRGSFLLMAIDMVVIILLFLFSPAVA